MDKFHGKVRGTSPKKPKWTTLIMIDSVAVKNTCNASIASGVITTTNGISIWRIAKF